MKPEARMLQVQIAQHRSATAIRHLTSGLGHPGQSASSA